jgi:hypothetical protein
MLSAPLRVRPIAGKAFHGDGRQFRAGDPRGERGAEFAPAAEIVRWCRFGRRPPAELAVLMGSRPFPMVPVTRMSIDRTGAGWPS